jgi:hypothetical protein
VLCNVFIKDSLRFPTPFHQSGFNRFEIFFARDGLARAGFQAGLPNGIFSNQESQNG